MKSDINKYGQFFTESEMCDWTLEIVNNIKKITGYVLEPSFGKGGFLDSLLKYNDIKVDGVEIDEKYFNEYINNKNLSLYNGDFLKFNNKKTYDFIIGNPPYIEICYSFYTKIQQDIIKKKYKNISNGRINLVHIFMEKSMNIINDDGIIAFLLPSAILTSPTYKTIRKKIFENFNVEYIKEDVQFKNVAIKVCLIVIRKMKNNGKYFYINNDNYFIMENYKLFKTTKTIKDYGFNVSIGEIVWNQNKEKLTNDNTKNKLLYSTNVGFDELLDNRNTRDRKNYIIDQEIRYKNCIVLPRTISKKIKFYFVKDNNNLIFENHLLIITNPDLTLLEKFYENIKSGLYNDLLVSFFNSSNLTKSELLSLPF